MRTWHLAGAARMQIAKTDFEVVTVFWKSAQGLEGEAYPDLRVPVLAQKFGAALPALYLSSRILF